MANQPTPHPKTYPSSRNQGLIAGLSKGNQWLRGTLIQKIGSTQLATATTSINHPYSPAHLFRDTFCLFFFSLNLGKTTWRNVQPGSIKPIDESTWNPNVAPCFDWNFGVSALCCFFLSKNRGQLVPSTLGESFFFSDRLQAWMSHMEWDKGDDDRYIKPSLKIEYWIGSYFS